MENLYYIANYVGLMLPSDVHERRPEVPIHLQEVGVTGIRIPIRVSLGRRSSIMVPKVSAFIDLPARQKGIHASRSSEAIAEAVSEEAGKQVRIEELCVKIAGKLLQKHPYARSAKVSANGEAVMAEKTPVTKVRTFEPYVLQGSARAWREGRTIRTSKMVGVEIVGMTVCPCASHMQRSHSSIAIEVPESYGLNALTLIKIAEEAMSAPAYEVLKREDEIALVKKAERRPRFAEDCLRVMAKGLIDSFSDLPDQSRVSFSVKSLESIHRHDFLARRDATLGILRSEVKSGGDI
ncbi:MAG: GTP cyclohydrolase, FolE2/MptA family [Candidatus Bathyarchaeia archaeon]